MLGQVDYSNVGQPVERELNGQRGEQYDRRWRRPAILGPMPISSRKMSMAVAASTDLNSMTAAWGRPAHRASPRLDDMTAGLPSLLSQQPGQAPHRRALRRPALAGAHQPAWRSS
jgi:hypothetical protein